MDTLLGMLRVLLTPSCWIVLNPYSKVWDERLREAMKEHVFVREGRYHCKLGPYLIWTENHPYGSMRLVHKGIERKLRPRRITVLRAGDKMEKDLWDKIP